MLHCWSTDPIDRPSFSELRRLFDQFLSRHTQDQYPYIDLEASHSFSQHKQDTTRCTASPLDLENDVDSVNILHSMSLESTEDAGLAHEVRRDSEAGSYNWKPLPWSENRASIFSMQESLRSTADSDLHFASSRSLDIAGDEPNFRYVPSPMRASHSATTIDSECPRRQPRHSCLSPSDVHYSRIVQCQRHSTTKSRSASPLPLSRAGVSRSLPDISCSERGPNSQLHEEATET